jgi:hypothetical protein
MCRAKSLKLLAEVQRLTGELIEMEHKQRNITLDQIPDELIREIKAQED